MFQRFSFLGKRMVPLAMAAMALASCNKMLETEPQGVLSAQNYYRDVFDADAAVWGVYGKMMNLAKPYLLLNELRADLMQPTGNADQYLQQLSQHTVTPDNPYISPQPFYEVILNCNDVLENFDRMLAAKKLKVQEYNQRYADIAAIRSWVYLQLGIHYGAVPYVTRSLQQVREVQDQSLIPRLPFNQLLDSLVKTLEGLPSMEEYPTGSTLRTTVDQYNTQKFFINKYCLLGDLYLWRGKGADYRKAATAYRTIMQTATTQGASGDQYYSQYRIFQADVVTNNDLSVGYTRFRETDRTALVDNNTQGWRSIFARAIDNREASWEWIWALPFDKNFAPANPFVELFSPVGGRYLLKPSQAAVDMWNGQVQVNNFNYDARGQFSWRTVLGQPVIMKYLYNYLEPNTGLPLGTIYDKNSKWFLYRAATLHLRYAEAANRDGRRKLAYALVNNGIKAQYDNPATVDNTNEMQTFDAAPYDFDARQGDPPGPVFRAEWFRGVGIRGRAFVKNVPVNGDSTLAVENITIDEAALETAYEGHRWPDLVRVAKRRNDPAFLADRVYQKLLKDGVPGAAATRARLLNPDNWYLPFKW
ncbi:SusD family protein [Cnuella takakiae]|uniref:SusD family protein n=1 Tax=Cnuella takakiae TaxID=1302690 RepID=A0A1M4UQD1_9BACT|nr:RagB/SusD family nutrient uptake outer membrane protein [Cnuella takakiae]OLY92803.1 RagB/SusD family protein [Cnuella takakiae]SHE58951.1 SusD family protein [Cnuella takakiae]